MRTRDEYHSTKTYRQEEYEADLQFFSIWNRSLQEKLTAVRKSYRWRIGHALIRMVELMLGRWKPKLAMDEIVEIMAMQDQYLKRRSHAIGETEYRKRREIRRDPVLISKLETGQLEIGFAVSEAKENARTGDFFTARQLGIALQKQFGYQIRFLERDKDWYDVEGIDVLICLLDNYRPDQIKNASPGLIRICWARNWFDRWLTGPSFNKYDLYLCSSRLGALYFEMVGGVPAQILPIATDFDQFSSGKYQKKYASDYVFTGHRWNADREIEKWLRPESLSYNFAIYGQGWEKSRKFRPFVRGHVSHANLPDVYASSRLVIDDANLATKPFGSINSRVFDALSAGTLVLTNGERGVHDLFLQEVPVYRNEEELHKLIRYYLSHDPERIELAQQLQQKIARLHNYDQRAQHLKNILEEFATGSGN